MHFNWQDIEDELDVMEEISDGMTCLERDDQLSIIAAFIYELGFSIKEVTDRIQQLDEAEYDYE